MPNVRTVAFPGWVAAVNAEAVAILEPCEAGTRITLRDGRVLYTPIGLREAHKVWTGYLTTSSERETAIELAEHTLEEINRG